MDQLLLIAWRQAENDACKAERAAAIAGSQASILQAKARRLREEADRQFAELLSPATAPRPAGAAAAAAMPR